VECWDKDIVSKEYMGDVELPLRWGFESS
jgi:hypothetical protein